MFKKKTTIEDLIQYLKTMNDNQIEALLEAVELYREADDKKLEALTAPALPFWNIKEEDELEFEEAPKKSKKK